jgi:hypothetical protein
VKNETQQHIIRVTAEQFKKVKVVDFVPNRYVTKISGANGAGKTSALDAIFQALAPRKTLSPALLRQGQKKGFLRIETTTHIITRKLDEKGGALQIEAKATGTLVKAPDDWLEGIAGELGFDPLKFMRLKPEDQFDVLKSLLPAMAQVDDLELRNETDAETITRKKAEAKRLEAARDHITVDTSLPSQPADVNALLAEARSAREHNASIEAAQRERDREDGDYAQENRRIAEIQKRHDELSEELLNLSRTRDAAREAQNARAESFAARQPLPALKDTQAIDEKISSAAATNSRITANNTSRAQKANLDTDVENIKDELKKLDEAVRERKITIARTLGEAKFPVPGLSFETIEEGSGGRDRKNPKKIVTYNGVALSEASSAEQIRVSTAIGMAGKPDLRFLLIREASLLDDEGMAILEQMAHEHEFQILAEVVDTSGKVGIYMEDGEIKNVNPETPPAKPTLVKKATKKASNQQELMHER